MSARVTEAMVEAGARGICLSQGADPDEMAPRALICGPKNERLPMWRYFAEQAEACLAAALSTEPGEAKDRALLDELSRLREENEKLKTALTLTPMAERLAELPDFMVALSEWGCTDPSEQAASITDFLNSLVGLKQYLEETHP